MMTPCNECLCMPICRNKDWEDCINECSILLRFFMERRYDFPLHPMSKVLEIIKSKEIFEEGRA